jgi:MFS family permease
LVGPGSGAAATAGLPKAAVRSKETGLKHKKKIFFGWWTVLATGILSGLGHGYYGYGFSVFFKDLAAELGLTRAVTALAAGVGKPAGDFSSPLVGWLADRYGPKFIIFFGVCLAGTGLILMNFIATTAQYLVVWGVFVGMGLNIGLTVAVDKSLADWFVLKRGLAQGTKFALIGVGGLTALPVVTLLVTHFGWRTTCLIWGCLLLSLSPLALVFVHQRRPEHYGLLPDGADAPEKTDDPPLTAPNDGSRVDYQVQETEFTFKQAVRTRSYWLLAAAFTIQMMIMGGVGIHVIPFLTDIGLDRARASAMMGLLVFFTIPSQFFSGIAADRLGKKYQNLLSVAVYSMQGAGLAVLVLNRGPASVYVFLVLYGFASGAATPLFILILARYFGRKAFGSIFGGSMIIRAPASMLAPVFSGWIYDRTGNYRLAFTVFACLALTAAAIMALVRPVAPAQKETAG